MTSTALFIRRAAGWLPALSGPGSFPRRSCRFRLLPQNGLRPPPPGTRLHVPGAPPPGPRPPAPITAAREFRRAICPSSPMVPRLRWQRPGQPGAKSRQLYLPPGARSSNNHLLSMLRPVLAAGRHSGTGGPGSSFPAARCFTSSVSRRRAPPAGRHSRAAPGYKKPGLPLENMDHRTVVDYHPPAPRSPAGRGGVARLLYFSSRSQ